MLALSLGGSGLFRRVFSACWCAHRCGLNIRSILRGQPLPLGRYVRGVLHGDAGVDAKILGLCEGAIASTGVVGCLCCGN